MSNTEFEHYGSNTISAFNYDKVFDTGFNIDLIVESFQIQKDLSNDDNLSKKCSHNEKKLMHDGTYCVECGEEFIECQHKDIAKDDFGMDICVDCGMEMNNLDYSKEWRYFGASDNKSNKDPSRCHKSKPKPKGITSAFNSESIDIPPALTEIVQTKYDKVLEYIQSENESQSKIVRGDKRKAIIAACLFYSYHLIGEVRTSVYVREQLGIKQKRMSEGIIYYLKTFPEDRDRRIKPKNLVKWLMRLTNVNVIHYKRIVALTKHLESASVVLKRSTPQALAASVIYFYLLLFPNCKPDPSTTKSQFAEATFLSDMTIIKLIIEIGKVTGINIKQRKSPPA